MRVGLIDVDSHRWPNLCLMKLSAYHKAQGYDVEWWRPDAHYDLVYKSRVFTDTYSSDTMRGFPSRTAARTTTVNPSRARWSFAGTILKSIPFSISAIHIWITGGQAQTQNAPRSRDY